MDRARIEDIQDYAFRAMHEMQDYLATKVGGDYLFSGTASDVQPVQFNYQTLSQFQTAFDGQLICYPTRCQANMANQTSGIADPGTLTFDAASGSIVAGNLHSLGGFPAGAILTVKGSALNDGRFQVLANDGTRLQIAQTLISEGSASAPVHSASIAVGTGAPMSLPLYFDAPAKITTATSGALDQLDNGRTSPFPAPPTMMAGTS
jgi:flagellin-like hook-associated protein FlgL